MSQQDIKGVRCAHPLQFSGLPLHAMECGHIKAIVQDSGRYHYNQGDVRLSYTSSHMASNVDVVRGCSIMGKFLHALLRLHKEGSTVEGCPCMIMHGVLLHAMYSYGKHRIYKDAMSVRAGHAKTSGNPASHLHCVTRSTCRMSCIIGLHACTCC